MFFHLRMFPIQIMVAFAVLALPTFSLTPFPLFPAFPALALFPMPVIVIAR